MVSRVLSLVDESSHRVVLAVAAGLLGLVTVLDYWSGAELTSAVFYLVPVALAGWRFDVRTSGPFALCATLLWVSVTMMLGVQHASLWMAVWDGVSRFIVYFSFAVLLGHVRSSLERLREMALTDHLTGVANSRFFHELAARELEHCRRHQRPFTLAYIDIDDFKGINDEFGHSGGDMVIRTVATALARNIRKVDHVARQGGDEFMLFLHEVEPEVAQGVLEQIHSRVSDALQQSGFDVSLSTGGVTWRTPPDTLDAAIHSADQVMYRVKGMEKGTVLHAVAGEERTDSDQSLDRTVASGAATASS